MSYVLITRPEIDAKSTAIAVQEKGYEVFCQSFLEVIYHDDLISDLEKYSALIFTSINGVRAYVQNIQNRDLPVFTVGDRTQAEVRQAGFKQVKSASGNVDNLIKLLSEEASKKPYLYVRGEYVTRAIKEALPNVRIEEKILYHTEIKEEIDTECVDLIRGGGFSDALFFSKRTAQAFVITITHDHFLKALYIALKT